MARTKFGLRLEKGLKEALAWKRGELDLPTVNVATEIEAGLWEAIAHRRGEITLPSRAHTPTTRPRR